MFSAGLSLNYSESANPLPYVSRLAEFNFFRRIIVSNNDGNIPKRAIIYMRVSSQKQVENQSIESQLRNTAINLSATFLLTNLAIRVRQMKKELSGHTLIQGSVLSNATVRHWTKH